MCRETEIGNMKIENVKVDMKNLEVSFYFETQKADQVGLGCTRTHGCCCREASKRGLPEEFCPVHAVINQMEELENKFKEISSKSFKKLPLFPTSQGRTTSKAQMLLLVEDTAKVLGQPITDAFGRNRFGRHSWRGTGAEYFIANMVALWRVELFGRWAPGSRAVHRYIRNAPLRQSRSLASHSVTGQGGWCETASLPATVNIDLNQIHDLIKNNVKDLDHSDKDFMAALEDAKTEVKDLLKDEREKNQAGAVEILKKCDFAQLFEEAFKERTLGKFNGKEAEMVLNLQKEGKLHVVAFADNRLKKDQWQTACGWRFAANDNCVKRHAFRGDGVDCPVCFGAQQYTARKAAGEKKRARGQTTRKPKNKKKDISSDSESSESSSESSGDKERKELEELVRLAGGEEVER